MKREISHFFKISLQDNLEVIPPWMRKEAIRRIDMSLGDLGYKRMFGNNFFMRTFRKVVDKMHDIFKGKFRFDVEFNKFLTKKIDFKKYAIAHRAKALIKHKENAFEHVIKRVLTNQNFELDVRYFKGKLYLSHDEVRKWSSDLEDFENLCLFLEEARSKAVILIDIKDLQAPDVLNELGKKYPKAFEHFIFASFSGNALFKVQEYWPKKPVVMHLLPVAGFPSVAKKFVDWVGRKQRMASVVKTAIASIDPAMEEAVRGFDLVFSGKIPKNKNDMHVSALLPRAAVKEVAPAMITVPSICLTVEVAEQIRQELAELGLADCKIAVWPVRDTYDAQKAVLAGADYLVTETLEV